MTGERESTPDYLAELQRVLLDPLFSRLMGTAPTEVQEQRPGDPTLSERMQVTYSIGEVLRGKYNDEGIRRWFERPRILLAGQSPLGYLGEGWNPEGDRASDILELARISR